jgi:hypothetical protein
MPPFEERNELLGERVCTVGATALSRGKARENVQKGRELQAWRMRANAARSGRLRNFGSVTRKGTVAKHLSEGRETVSANSASEGTNRWEEGLRSVGFPLEVWIGNQVPTFNAAHLAGVVFLFRDAKTIVGLQAVYLRTNRG